MYGPRRTGSRPSRISIARILGAPVIEPPGNEAASRSKASRPAASRPVTVETRCWTAAVRSRRQQPRDADAARATDPAEVVAQHVHDHHVLGAVLGAAEQLARERAVLRPRSRPRGRVPLIGSRADAALGVDRQERLGRGREERARPAGQLARAQVEVRGEERRIAGPQAAVQRPTGRRRTASRAVGSGWPGRCRRARCARGSASTPAS